MRRSQIMPETSLGAANATSVLATESKDAESMGAEAVNAKTKSTGANTEARTPGATPLQAASTQTALTGLASSREASPKIIVIDDDPTGSQTVHGCLLLTRWDPQTLDEALADPSPLFFVLSNTRGMSAAEAAEVTRDICAQVRGALNRLAACGRPVQPLVVSRSDSTLRGHYPVETDVIAAHLGPFDAHFLVPAFFEGGRFTRASVHYLMVEGVPVPVNETEFARDSVFGFRHAFLPDYVEEKTGGRIPAAQVERFDLAAVRGDLRARLQDLDGNRCCVVDAEQQSDLDHFARQVMAASAQGKRFLFRSAASLLTALANLPAQAVAPAAMGHYVRDAGPGVVLMGSHVEKSTRQLRHLIRNTNICPIEVDLARLGAAPTGHAPTQDAHLLDEVLDAVSAARDKDRGVVLYTSRGERQFPSIAERLAFGERVSGFLMQIVRNLPNDIGFLISKGGITSNDTLSQGLALRTARVLGQIRPGCSMVRCPQDHPRYPNLPVVIFPGNVGGDESLTEVYRILTRA